MTKSLVQTEPQLNELLDNLRSRDIFSLDCETNGELSLFDVSLVGLSFGWEDQAVYVPLNHLEGEQLDLIYVIEKIRPFIEDASKAKVYHYSKYDEMVLSTYGLNPVGPIYDTFIMARLFNELLESYSLKNLVLALFDYRMQTYEEVVDAVPRKRGEKKDYNFAKVPLEDAVSYAADDALWTYKLYTFLRKRLEEENIWNVYKHIEGPLVRVVRKMETRGITIDATEIKRADEYFPKLMEEIEAEIYIDAGQVFKIGSGDQLGKVLFDKLKISDTAKKTATGKYKTDAKTLEIYNRHKIVESVLRWKKVRKTHTTFVKGLGKFIQKDGKIHAQFNSTGTDTGRFSSSKPNLQNQQGDQIEDIKVRDFFIPSPGFSLIVADYSQIELRMIAHFSKDKNMIQAFLSKTRDFHDETARKMLLMQGTPIGDDEDVLPRQRFNAKTLNFGIPYGRGDLSVATMLGVYRRCAHWQTWDPSDKVWKYINPETHEETAQQDPCHNCGKCFIRDWFAAFPSVEPFRNTVIEAARAREYVRTLSGRKRRIEAINSKDFFKRAHAERQAFSTKIQGSAGDIIKLAMVSLSPELEKMGAHILMTVHDELVMEAPKEIAEDVVGITKTIMENPFEGKNPLILPLIVNPQICERWSEGK